MSTVFEDSEKYEYTTSNAIFNILNQTVNFATQPNANFTANISSKENDAILLSEAYFMIEYNVRSTTAFRLCANWFLSALNSFNLSINSFSMQYNSIFASRSLPMLSQTLRYLQYEDSDFNKLNSIQRELFQNVIQDVDVAGEVGISNINVVKYYPIEEYPAVAGGALSNTKNYCVVHLKDIFPSVGQFQQVNGLLSMSMVLSYNSLLQSLGTPITGGAESGFTLSMINFHYPVRTFNMKNSIDLDLNYLSTFGILNGTVPQIFKFDFPAPNAGAGITGTAAPFDKVQQITMSNIQLSVNKIYKLLIFPVFSPTATVAGSVLSFKLGNKTVTTPALAINTADPVNLNNNNVLSTFYGLGTPIGSVGSPLFNIRNFKTIVNGAVIVPTNVVQGYTSEFYSEWYNYNFSFNGQSIDKIKKPNLWFNSNMYKFFKPIVVDLSNATANNSFNSLSFSFDVYNAFSKAAAGAFSYDLRVDYVILNEVVLNDS